MVAHHSTSIPSERGILSHSEHKSKKSDIVTHKRAGRTPDQGGTGDGNVKVSSALDDIVAKGSYAQLKNSLRSMSRAERFDVLSRDLCAVRSGFGFRLDVPEKMAIIDEFGGGRADYFKNKVLTEVVFEVDPAGDVDFLRSIDTRLWQGALAAAATFDAGKAFELTSADVGIERQQQGIREVLRVWLGSDSLAASEQVSKMPQGQLRDFAIGEIACWLQNKNCKEDAKRWAERISDPALKNKTIASLSESGVSP